MNYKFHECFRVAIFVPYDCQNNCKFCPTKKYYKNFKFNLEKTLSTIKKVKNSGLFTEFMITGGEPLADLNILKQIVNACKGHDIYINTTLPKSENIDEIIDFINNNDDIRGLAISRHINQELLNVCDKDIINKIKKDNWINTVVNENTDKSKLLNFIKSWDDVSTISCVNIRHQYQELTKENLYLDTEISNFLQQNFKLNKASSCDICCSKVYNNNDKFVRYIKQLNSAFYKDDVLHIYHNMIISPEGDLCYDWKFNKDQTLNKLVFGEINNISKTIIKDKYNTYLYNFKNHIFGPEKSKAQVIQNSLYLDQAETFIQNPKFIKLWDNI